MQFLVYENGGSMEQPSQGSKDSQVLGLEVLAFHKLSLQALGI